MFTLSQMNDRVKIMNLFFESLNELFKPCKFFFSENAPQKEPYFEKIVSKGISYGYLVCKKTPDEEIIGSLQNVVQMLAVILDRHRMDNELKHKARSLESVAQKRLEAIKANVIELENYRKDSQKLIKNLKKEIIGRQKIENDLRESEAKFRLSFQTSADAASINRLEDGLYVDINQGFTDISGYTADEIVGKTSQEINIWADLNVRKKLVNEVKEHGKLYNLQAKFRTKDGRIVDGLMSASLINLNNVPHIINITKDISEIIKVQNELKESELRFRKAFENSTSGMCTVSTEGRFLQVNPKMCEILGYSPEELLGKKFPEVTHPEDAHLGWDDMKKILEGEKDSSTFEKRYIRKDGKIIWGEVSFSIIRGSENTSDIFITHMNDITEKKNAEENIKRERDQAQRYLDIAGVMFASLNVNGEIEIINKKGCEILGYRKAKDLVGKNWFDVCLPEGDRDEVLHVFEELMAGNIKNNEYYENSVITKSGEIRFIGFHNTVLQDPEGNNTGILFLGEDITEREKAKKILIETQDQLSTIYNMVGDVIFYLKVEEKGTYRFLTVNDMFCKATGLKKEQVEGKNVNEVIPEPSRSLVLKNYKKAIKQKSIVWWEETTHYPTGVKTGIVSVSPVYNDEGKCTFLVGSVHDITERKKAEEEIKDLARFPTENPNAVLRINKDGIIIFANSGSDPLLKIWNTKVGQSVPEDIFEKISISFKKRKNLKVEVVSEQAIIECFFAPVTERNYIDIYGRDITERKKAEEVIKRERDQAQRYLDIAGVMFASLNTKGEITIINKKGCEILGYDGAEELMGKSWLEVCLPEANKEEVKNVFREQMAGNIKPFEYYENSVITKSGEERLIAFHNTILQDPDGNITGVLFSGEDITERIKAEEEIKKLNTELEKRVIERTAELEDANKELEEVNDVFVGREMRIIELKEEVERLKNKLKGK